MLRAARQDEFSHLDQVRILPERSSLAVIDDQHIDLLQHLPQRVAFPVDPEIHRIAGHETRALHLLQDIELQIGVDVAEEQHIG